MHSIPKIRFVCHVEVTSQFHLFSSRKRLEYNRLNLFYLRKLGVARSEIILIEDAVLRRAERLGQQTMHCTSNIRYHPIVKATREEDLCSMKLLLQSMMYANKCLSKVSGVAQSSFVN
ncbi:hypothetical protein YQ44_21120 [Janthinobacterium sp. 1_2014MBL_MicDiv]|nr:hypothetical protein YQ44_21120 [Janthinobacterium sp. 1_2014MBL_MicDiv]